MNKERDETPNVDNYYVDCTNPECGWSGLMSETVATGGDNNEEDSCPKCYSIVEPHEF